MKRSEYEIVVLYFEEKENNLMNFGLVIFNNVALVLCSQCVYLRWSSSVVLYVIIMSTFIYVLVLNYKYTKQKSNLIKVNW